MAVTISDNPYLNPAIHIPSDMENFAVSSIYEDIMLFGLLMSGGCGKENGVTTDHIRQSISEASNPYLKI